MTLTEMIYWMSLFIAVVTVVLFIINRIKRNVFIITLNQLESKMQESGFDDFLIKDILHLFSKRIEKHGEKEFTNWLTHLNYTIPEEYEDEEVAIQMYGKCESWIEEDVAKLEVETQLSWEEQTGDIHHLDKRARKAQLVIRHRLNDVVLDLMDKERYM